MTDTTDIAAIVVDMRSRAITRINNGGYPEISVMAADLVLILDRLEAERQRADAKDNAISLATEIARKASDKIERIEAELAALNSAHGNVVTRCALLRQRPDLPVDRIPAYNSLVKAQEEVKELRKKLANPVVLPPVEIVNGGCILCGKLHPAGMQCPRLRVTSIKGE